MRRFSAIVLLLVHLFNLGGYSLFFGYLMHDASKKLITRIDLKEYDESKLLELKIAVRLPYVNNQLNYERVDGEIEVDGIYYNYVERRITTDTIYLKYLPHLFKTELNQAKNVFVNELSNLPVDSKSKKPVVEKNTVLYYSIQTTYKFEVPECHVEPSISGSAKHLINLDPEIPTPPPEAFVTSLLPKFSEEQVA